VREEARLILARLHAAQGAFYAGEDPDGAALREVLTDDIVWHVPGSSPIAGTYRGIDAVLGYVARRRDLANETFRMHPGDLLTGEGDRVAVLTDGTATIGGVEHRWSTVGLYRLRDGRVAETHLLPLDPVAFDRIWTP
jgi:ketosteroid isomerase-like protein